MSDVVAENRFFARAYIRYSIAVAAVVAAFLLHLALVQFLGHTLPPFILVFPTIMVVSLLCGAYPGLAATVVAALLADYWLMPPIGSFAIKSAADAIALALFFGMGAFMSVVAERYHRNQQRIAAYKKELALRESQEELRKSEERYRNLFNSMDEGFCIIEMIFDGEGKPADYRFLTVNPAFERQTGLYEAVGKRMRELAPDHEAHWFEIYGRIALTGEPAHFVDEAKALNRYYNVHAYRVGEPEMRRVAIVFDDFSEIKRAEEALREREVLLRTVTESSRVGLVMLSPDRHYLYANTAYAEVLGLSTTDIVGKRVPDVMGHVYDQISPRLDRAFAGERVNYELKVPAPQGAGDEGRNRSYAITYEPLQSNDEGSRVIVVVVDITAQKQAEEAVRESEERLRLMVGNVKDYALFMLDPEGRVVNWNSGAQEMKGYAADEIVGEHFSRFYTPQDIAAGKPQMELAIALEEGKYSEEGWRVRQDGSKFPASVTITAIHGADGQLRGFAKITRDITERRQKEESLRSSQAKLQGIVGSAMDAIVSVDEQQRIVVFNRAAELVFQCQASEALGSTLDRFIPESLREVHHEHLRLFGSAGVTARSMFSPGILAAVRSNGEEFPIEATISQVQADGEKLFTVILRDITERKQAEAALRESLERLEKVLEVQTVGVMFWDLNTGFMVDANDAFLNLMGYSRSDIEERRLNWQQLTPPEYIDMSRAEVEKFLATGRVGPYEKEYFRKDGTKKWLLFAGSSLGNNQCVEFCVDISDRKQAERENARLAAIVESSGDAIIGTDLDGIVSSWNYSAEKLFGYSAEEIIGHPIDLVIPPDRNHEEAAFLERLRRGDSIDHYETVRMDKDGRYIDVSLTLSPIRDAFGAVIGASKSVRDITAQKQAEKALRESQAQFRTLADAIPQLCWTANADGFIFWYNDRWYEYTGTTPEQMEGWGWQSVHNPDTLPNVLERWQASIATGKPFDMVLPLRGGDGVFRPFLTRVMPLKDTAGKVVRWFGTNTDVTELRNAQEALRASEQRWATTLQSIGDAVISTCAQGNIVFMNDVAERLTGWTLPEAKGRDLTAVFDIVQEVTRIKPENPVAKVIRLGKVIGLANHTVLIHRDGSEIPIEDSAAPIRDTKGQMEGVVLVFHDVMEQRKVEATLRNSDRLATTGKLAATIAHEIHNPLDAVGNLLFLIGQDAKNDTTRQYVATASAELTRVTQMTRQMLVFQRDAAKPVPVKIREILDSVTSLFERKIASAGIRLERQIDFDGHILVQPGELRQIFANLVGNAIEAMGARRGTITLRAYQSQDRRRGRPGLRVLVADDGPGIPEHVRGKIFEPFFTTKGESGTGLGLWIASDILRKYDGTMRLRSSTHSHRSGTCFSVFVPFENNPDSPERS
jgi:PAS domain S-box-containing protein